MGKLWENDVASIFTMSENKMEHRKYDKNTEDSKMREIYRRSNLVLRNGKYTN